MLLGVFSQILCTTQNELEQLSYAMCAENWEIGYLKNVD